ncbi:NUDIX domain-containing protein [Phytomonospora sp. NPDC050363]|uniref:NUDIX domain-containing protein n=1 Tax=Phytomonospora sp. NPDC050363 TaxID=3155642 RepID=UPI0033C79077
MPEPKTLTEGDARDGIQQQVVGGVIAHDGLILLLRRAPAEYMAGQWELPSGKVDPGEDLFTALHREVLEETGLVVEKVGAYLGSFDYTSRGIRMRQHNWELRVTAVEPVRLCPEEHDAFEWVKPGDAPGPVSPDVRGLLNAIA